MNITVLFFGITTDLVGESLLHYNLQGKSSVKELKETLKLDYSTLKNIHEYAIAVNEEYVNDEFLIKDGDIVAIIPPVSGG